MSNPEQSNTVAWRWRNRILSKPSCFAPSLMKLSEGCWLRPNCIVQRLARRPSRFP